MKKAILSVLAAISVVLSGCTASAAPKDRLPEKADISVTEEEKTAESAVHTESTSVNIDLQNVFSERDLSGTYDPAKAVRVMFDGDSVSCDSDAVKTDESSVTVTDEGCYILSGKWNNGTIIVDADKEDKVQLVLDNVSIHSETSAPLYVLKADKVFLTAAEGTENVFSNGGVFEAIDENNIDAVIFSKEDLTMNGKGNLSVSSPAGHGVVSKDELTVTGGSYTLETASHGLVGKDSVCITSSQFQIASGKDGIHAENKDDTALGYVYIESGTFSITAEGDGISASHCMQIDGGSYDIVTGGGSVNAEKKTSDAWGKGGMPSGVMPGNRPGGGPKGERPVMNIPKTDTEDNSTEDSTSIKGLKSKDSFMINDGTFVLDCADDAVHSNSSLTVNGGCFEIKSGDDGFHADAGLSVNNGVISVTACYEGLEGLHVAVHGGEISILADDDGINAAGGTDASGFGGMRGGDMFAADTDSFVLTAGGTLYIEAGGDCVDSNGSFEITGGTVQLCGQTVGDTSVIDYASTGKISGGVLIGTGSAMMAQTMESVGQGIIPLKVGNQTAGTALSVADKNGNTILSAEPALNYEIAILSCPEMKKGETYTVTVGSVSADFAAQ